MGLKVIGTGLGRTGTTSLKVALEQLGFGRCHHMTEIFLQPERVPLWIEAGEGRPDWDAIFEGYGAAVDHPSCDYWRELAAYYPDARLIHTVRDPDAWFESAHATIWAPDSPATHAPPLFQRFFETQFKGFPKDVQDRDAMIDFYHWHSAEVLAQAPKDRLLVLEVGAGWAPLCAFLGVPVPDTPYPHANDRTSFNNRVRDHGAPDQAAIRALVQGEPGA